MANTNAIMTALYGDGSSVSSYTPTLREKGVDWFARNWYGDNREGVRRAEKLSNLLETVTPYGVATMAYDAGRAGASGDYLGAGLMGAMAMAPLPSSVEKGAAKGIRAFHGSPHSFDRFSMDKIGTGEGAQAYGHGLYFAENEDIARSYRDGLSPKIKLLDGKPAETPAEKWVEQLLSKHSADHDFSGYFSTMEELSPELKPMINDAKEILKRNAGKGLGSKIDGSMYEVRINANPEDFLDWDKPLSEQSEAVKGVLPNLPSYSMADSQNASGELLYRSLGGLDRNVDAVKSLREAGIPGIKYLDAGSRGNVNVNNIRGSLSMWETALKKTPNDPFAQQQVAGLKKQLEDAEKPGTRNYVVFDDKLIEIVRKYGIAGASALLGMNVLANMNEAQASQLKKAENMGKIQNSLLSGGW